MNLTVNYLLYPVTYNFRQIYNLKLSSDITLREWYYGNTYFGAAIARPASTPMRSHDQWTYGVCLKVRSISTHTYPMCGLTTPRCRMGSRHP